MTPTLEKEKQYKISEMTKFINVEAHVLRYWEEELQLPIKRNELGHRYYTEEDKELFLKVKKLKEKGVQLKGIRTMLNLSENESVFDVEKADDSPIKINISKVTPLYGGTSDNSPRKVKAGENTLPSKITRVSDTTLNFADNREEKSMRLQLLLKGLIQEAVEESNAKMAEDIKECLVKEMDYQFRVASEEEEQRKKIYLKQQEEYFQKLDEMIQSGRHGKKKKTSKWLKKTENKEKDKIQLD